MNKNLQKKDRIQKEVSNASFLNGKSVLPHHIEDYQLVKEVFFNKRSQLYHFGLYRNQEGVVGFAKQLKQTGTKRAGYWLQNEIHAYTLLKEVCDTHSMLSTQFPNIRVPNILYADAENPTLLLTEYIEGKRLNEFPREQRVNIYLEVLDFLTFIGKAMSQKQIKKITTRKHTHWVLTLLLSTIQSSIRYPRHLPTIVQGFFFCITHLPQLVRYSQYGFSHRDICDENILVEKETVWIIDFQLAAHTYALYDTALVSFNLCRYPEVGKMFLQNQKLQMIREDDFLFTVFRVLAIHLALYDLGTKPSMPSQNVIEYIKSNLKNKYE